MLGLGRLINSSRWNSKPEFRLDDGDRAVIDIPGTLVLPMQRYRLLRYLPSRCRIAEIGVARGRFSAQLVSICQPTFLALVDPWLNQEQNVYFGDSNNAGQKEQDNRYAQVHRRFASTRSNNECRVLRMFSVDAAREFEDGFFDWVFVDGNHSHEACLEDLRAWAPKVNDDGLLCGHDFANHASARSAKYGVVSAVRQFVEETGYLLAAVTVEHFPTFVIAKNPSGATLARLRRLLFSNEPHTIQIPSGAALNFAHARIMDGAKPRSAFMSFDAGR